MSLKCNLYIELIMKYSTCFCPSIRRVILLLLRYSPFIKIWRIASLENKTWIDVDEGPDRKWNIGIHSSVFWAFDEISLNSTRFYNQFLFSVVILFPFARDGARATYDKTCSTEGWNRVRKSAVTPVTPLSLIGHAESRFIICVIQRITGLSK